MSNIILEKIARLLLRVIAAVSILLLLRGHNSPGGGFIAGIVLATGFIYYGIIFSSDNIKSIIYFKTRTWMGVGMALVLIAAVLPVFVGQVPLTALWYIGEWPLIGTMHIGTPLLFDTGIFIGVTGIILSIIITIMEVLRWNT